jgi:phospholipid/cholesterol/gamma-HCH transport system substrate-binding protein
MANLASAKQIGRVYGVLFLAIVVFFVWLTYAVFTKKFSDYDEVTLQSSKIGLALPARADVKIRGVQVGEVLETRTTGDGAELTLGLYPDQVRSIPADVSAQILPKTLFGEKYVSLEVPASPSSTSIKAGDVIKQGEVALELEAVLNDLFPLLRTVRPAELNYTLTAIANALEGRGDKLGESFETLDGYLKRMNPEIPALIESLDRLGSVSATYESVVPELTRVLRNTVKTTNTFESKEDQVQALFNDVAGFSGTTEAFLDQNGDNIVTLADQGRQILPLIARYSPQFRCFLRGAVEAIPRNEEAFRGKTLHIILETVPQPRGYTPADKPANADNRGSFPYCDLLYKAINGGYNQDNLPPDAFVPRINDGVKYPIKPRQRAPIGDAVVGTASEQAQLDIAVAPVLGVTPDRVPDLATLLLGPLARGMQVDVR